MVKVQFGDIGAEVENQVWQCENDALFGALTSMLPLYGVSPSDPHPDLTVAQEAANVLGGVIVDDSGQPESVPGVVY